MLNPSSPQNPRQHLPLPINRMGCKVAALNGDASAISIQSTNYPSMYITVDQNHRESGRLGIATVGTDKDSASFVLGTGASDPKGSTLTVAGGDFKGSVVMVNGLLQGPCSSNYHDDASDVILAKRSSSAAANMTFFFQAPPPPAPLMVTVDAGSSSHKINSLYMGCHR